MVRSYANVIDRGSRTARGLATIAAALFVITSAAHAEEWYQGEDVGVGGVGCAARQSNFPTACVRGKRVRVDLEEFTNGRAALFCERFLELPGEAYGVLTEGQLKIAGDFFTVKGDAVHGYVRVVFPEQRLLAYAAPKIPDQLQGRIDPREPSFPTIDLHGHHRPDFARLVELLAREDAMAPDGVRPYLALGKLTNGHGHFDVDAFGLKGAGPPGEPRFVMQAAGEIVQSPKGRLVLVTRAGARIRLHGAETLDRYRDVTLFGIYDDLSGELRVFGQP